MNLFPGSVTSPQGFEAAAITAGIKQSGNADMTLIFSQAPCVAAGAFTQNKFTAAPVLQCLEVIDHAQHQAVIINSGVANACTGQQGFNDALTMAAETATALSATGKATLKPEEVFVSSTGRIGVFLPMDKISAGIKLAVDGLSEEAGEDAARGIMTTDTVPKFIATSFELNGQKVTIGGITKGAGMINPNMKAKHGTMLAYLTTDAAVDKAFLQYALNETLDASFNRITVDGDTSTNDTYLALANGLAGNETLTMADIDSEAAQTFVAAMKAVSAELARQMVLDGEGATKFVEIEVVGAVNNAEARLAAEAIANSLLCKTAWFGADPNWGRILDAAGYSGADLNPNAVNLWYNGLPVVKDGFDAGEPEDKLANILRLPEFALKLDLAMGEGVYTAWTCDLSYEYVKINADYHT